MPRTDLSGATTVLVTGGAGFIGSNFIRQVLARRPAWRVINLDALTYAGNPGNLEDLPREAAHRHELVRGDLCDAGLLDRLFRQHRFDAVIHFAAESHVDRSILGPEAFVATNVVGTFRLLEAARNAWERTGQPEGFRFLHVSTDEVYGSLGPTGHFTEATAYAPSSPYAASKAASDHFVGAYHRTYGLPTLVTNSSNNYGPYQFPEKLIPLMILNLADQRPLPVYGDGKNVRDWLYVEDHCDALLLALEQGQPGEAYTIGGGAERENLQVVERLCDLVDRWFRRPAGSSRKLVRFVADRPGHDRRYAVDSTKIRKTLGWAPLHSFEDALARTVDWYLSNLAWVEDVRSGTYRERTERNPSRGQD